MKKGAVILMSICALFLSMTVGIFIGRNLDDEYVAMPQSSAVTVLTDNTQSGIKQTDDFRLDINLASKVQLMELPDIGEITAQKIIDYRETYGPFQSTDDLLNIDGIGQKKLKVIEEYITVGG